MVGVVNVVSFVGEYVGYVKVVSVVIGYQVV